MTVFNTLVHQIDLDSPAALDSLIWPASLKLLVISPHPDDFDAISVTLKNFHLLGCTIHLAVLSGGAKGVEDGFSESDDWAIKGKIRENEQLDSCRLFGLAEDSISFLRLPEALDGELDNNEVSRYRVHQLITDYCPDIVLLPYGKDTNTAHQRAYAMVRAYGLETKHNLLALYNNDAKSTCFTPQLYVGFNSTKAEWKGELLRAHQSQHARNLNQRGHGFDDRVLSFNRDNAKRLNLIDLEYAEAFQYELFAGSSLG